MWFSRSQHETRLYKLCKWGKDHGTTAIEKLRPQRKFTECAHYSNLVKGAQVYLDKVADENVAYLLDIETNKKSDVIDIENGSTNISDNGSSLDIDSENSWDPDLDTSDIGDDELYGEFGDEEGETWEIDESEVNNLVNDWKESLVLLMIRLSLYCMRLLSLVRTQRTRLLKKMRLAKQHAAQLRIRLLEVSTHVHIMFILYIQYN